MSFLNWLKGLFVQRPRTQHDTTRETSLENDDTRTQRGTTFEQSHGSIGTSAQRGVTREQSQNNSNTTVIGSSCEYAYNEILNRGKYGVVYRAQITQRGDFNGANIVAVKILHFGEEYSFPGQKKFAKLLEIDTHLNVVPYHRIQILQGLGGTTVEIMMEYCSGGNLANRIQRLRGNAVMLELSTVIKYAADMAAGLTFLHKQRFIHGNLNPSSVLIKQFDYAEEVLVIGSLDNFIAMGETVTNSQDISDVRGEIPYMAPEMFRKMFQIVESTTDSNPGRKSDVWSLGCIILDLANCITGNHTKVLWKDEYRIEIEEHTPASRYGTLILDGYIPLVPDTIPSNLHHCIQQCLQGDPLFRTTAAQLTASLAELIQGFDRQLEVVIRDESFPVGSNYDYSFDPGKDIIGSGGFGFVYRADLKSHENFSKDNSVAIKVIHFGEDFVGDPRKFVKLRNKYKILVTLQHEHLVTYHQVKLIKGENGISVHLMMDRYLGGNLRSVLKKLRDSEECLDELTALKYAEQITDGLTYLHDRSLLHGDLKPGNVLVQNNDGCSKLLICDLDDFVQMHLTESTNPRGTYLYMSPEMILKVLCRTDKWPAEKTDVWSLGCVILDLGLSIIGESKREIWLGSRQKRIEINEQTTSARFAAWIVDDGFVPFIPDAVPPSFALCIQRCLQVDPKDRISAAELKIQLHSNYS